MTVKMGAQKMTRGAPAGGVGAAVGLLIVQAFDLEPSLGPVLANVIDAAIVFLTATAGAAPVIYRTANTPKET